MNERERSIARFVDGEMARDELVAFEARLRDDAPLRDDVAEARKLRALFAPERGAAPMVRDPRASTAFRARVLAAAATAAEAPRRNDVEHLARQVIAVAAAVLVAVVIAAFGLLNRADSGRLEASPAEMQRTLEKLDAKIRGAEPVPEAR